jgi:phosphate transport system substrate-binding protein
MFNEKNLMNMNKVSLIQNFIIIACRIKNFTISNLVDRNRKNRFHLFAIYSLMGIMVLFISCNSSGPKKVLNETPTRGTIKIISDESFKPIIETEVFTFTHIYDNASITPIYKSETDVINDFMNDSIKVIVTSMKLTDSQIQYLRDMQIIARTSKFAYDALAIVTNKSNTDSLFKYTEIRDIFLGNVKSWKEIEKKTNLGDIRVIFDNSKSGNIRYFRELFGIKDALPENFFAVNSNPEVIKFVSRNPDAMGIVSMNWLSDKDDSTNVNLRKKIHIAAISQQYINDGSYYKPEQGFIYNKSYPFVRDVYMITRESFSGLGSGFINWICGEQGQRIVLKSGLVPATMPIRLVQIKN